MPRAVDRVWVEVQAVRRGAPVGLCDDAIYFAIGTGFEVGGGTRPGSTVNFGGVGDQTAVGTKEGPRNDWTNMVGVLDRK